MRFLSLVVLLAAPAALAQTGTVAGTVLDPAGRPIPGAHVRVEATRLGASADASGRFAVRGVAAGSADVVATAVGYTPARAAVAVVAGEAADVRLVLAVRTLGVGEAVVVARESLTGPGTRPGFGSAHVVGSQALARFETTDLNRALREVPGVQLQQEDGYGLRSNIGLRGSGSERSSKVTLMEDGVLIAPAPYAAPAAYYTPSVARMDGVEVRTGASQIKYGPFTTGGAVNFVTAAVPDALDVRAVAVAGPDGRRTAHARAGDTRAVGALGGLRVGVLVQGLLDGAEGFKTLAGPSGGETGFTKVDAVARLRLATAPAARVAQALTLTASRTDELSHETYLGLTEADFAATPFVRYAGSARDRMELDQTSLRARHVAVFSDRLDVTTTAYRTAFSRNWYKVERAAGTLTGAFVGNAAVLADPVRYAAELATLQGTGAGRLELRNNARTYGSRGVQAVVGLRLGGRAGVGALVEAGGRLHRDYEDRFQWSDVYRFEAGALALVSAGTPGTQANRVVGARAASGFVQAEITAGPLVLTPGLRRERVRLDDRNYGTADVERAGTALVERDNDVAAWIPGVGALVRATDALSLSAGVHRGFAPPNAEPDARPEQSVNVEVGVRLAGRAGTAQLVGFANEYSNLLGRDLAAAGGTGTGDQFNGGTALVRGLEAVAEGDLAAAGGLAGWRLPVRVAYTLTDARFRSEFVSTYGAWGTVAEGDRLPYLPGHQVGGSVGVERGPGRLTLAGLSTSAARDVAGQGAVPDGRRIPPAALFDLAGEYALRPAGRAGAVSLLARVENVFDATLAVSRRPAGLRPGLPRTFTLGVRTAL